MSNVMIYVLHMLFTSYPESKGKVQSPHPTKISWDRDHGKLHYLLL